MSSYMGKSKLIIVPAKSMKNHVAEYCSNTSIHGIKYLAERNRPFAEKLWWATIFVTCVVGNAFLIQKAWIKWHESPVIVTFNERTMPVWSIPFPAVTICSEQKSKASVFNYTDAIYNYDPNNTRLQDIYLLCDGNIGLRGNNITDNSTLDFLLEAAPSRRETVKICTWMNKHTCEHFFSQIITEDGFCFSFNMLNTQDLFRDHGIPYYLEHGNVENTSTDWTLENGYPPSSKVGKSYPFRAVGAGSTSELKLVLIANTKNNDYLCRLAEGFKIVLHNPVEIPGMRDIYSRVPLKSETVIAVKPNVITTHESLRSYSPDIRQCYFPSERYLAHFKVYTQKNCELECLTNFTLKTCGCVAMHMPRDEKTPICGVRRKDCYLVANDILRDIETAGDGKQNESSCNCLPSCISIEYDGEFSETDFDVEQLHKIMEGKLSFFEDGISFSRISIFFKQPQFITIKRTELYGLVDFLANCGGLLGLFLGISLLSFVEIFYYAILRCCVNFIVGKKKKGRKSIVV